MSPLRVLCVLPLTHDVRIARRVDMHHEAGTHVEAVAFERDHLGGRLPDCPLELLGTLLHGRLLRRVPRLLKSARRVRAAMRRNDVVHAFNPDMALLALVSGIGLGKPVVVEVADIREVQTAEGWVGRAVRALDRITLEHCQLLIVTSSHYFRYYWDWLRVKTPCLVLENKHRASFCDQVQAIDSFGVPNYTVKDGPLRIGWFGRLRDGWSMQVVDTLTRLSPSQISFVIAGSLSPPVGDLPNLLAVNSGIEYLGPYSHPEDLPALFNAVDMVMACYSPEVPSGWSRSNRFYDACLFGRPLIVRAGCADADETARHDRAGSSEDESPGRGQRLHSSVDEGKIWTAAAKICVPCQGPCHGDTEALRRAMDRKGP